MRVIRHRILLRSVSLIGLAALAQPAWADAKADASAAEDADTAGVTDIIVTARRAGESYINVPVPVSVQSAEQLQQTNANDLAKIAENIPFVQITKTSSGSGGAFVIRGIGSFGTDVGISQPVLVNLDNVFVGRPRIITQGQYDIGQVEVLKGPQPLFYGKNSSAGVISLSSQDPNGKFEGYLRGSYEFKADERIIEGAVSAPLTDTLAVRVAGRAAGMKGYLRNSSTGYAANPLARVSASWAPFPVPGGVSNRAPVTDDLGGRITLLWKPVDGLKVNLKYSYGISHADGDNSTNETFCDPSRATTITTFGIVDTQADCSRNQVVTHSGFPVGLTVNYPYANGGVPYATAKTHFVSFGVDYDTDNVSISSNTGYYKLSYNGAQNAYHNGLGANWSAQTEFSHGFSEELRLTTKLDGPVNFVVGGYFGDQKQANQSFSFILGGVAPDPANGGSYYTYERLVKQATKTWSAFGQARWEINDVFGLDAGIRYTNEHKTDLNGNAYVAPGFVASARAAGNYFNRARTDTDLSPEVTLSWKPAAGQLVYATYKQGFKSGGYSAPPVLTAAFTDAGTTFNPEKAKGFEVGYKAELLDRKVRLELTGYRYNYSNQQVSVFVPASLGFLVTNAGASRLQGIEASLSAKVSDGLSFNASVGYNDAHFTNYTGAACYVGQTVAQGCVATGVGTSTAQDLSGVQLPRAPKWAGTFGASYQSTIDDKLKIMLTGGGRFNSSYNASDNVDPFELQSGFMKLDGSITLSTVDDKFAVSLIGRNITNQYTLTFSQDLARGGVGQYLGYFGRPREVALQGTVRF